MFYLRVPHRRTCSRVIVVQSRCLHVLHRHFLTRRASYAIPPFTHRTLRQFGGPFWGHCEVRSPPKRAGIRTPSLRAHAYDLTVQHERRCGSDSSACIGVAAPRRTKADRGPLGGEHPRAVRPTKGASARFTPLHHPSRGGALPAARVLACLEGEAAHEACICEGPGERGPG